MPEARIVVRRDAVFVIPSLELLELAQSQQRDRLRDAEVGRRVAQSTRVDKAASRVWRLPQTLALPRVAFLKGTGL